jgi:hypothetical protein
MDKPLLYLGLLTSIFGAVVLFVVIPAQSIPPILSSVSPDFYPNIGTIMLIFGGIGLMISSVLGDKKRVDLKKLTDALKFAGVMATLFGLTLLAFEFINFIAGGIFLVLISMWMSGERRPLFLIPVSAGAPVLIWLFIDVLLGRSLP